jgi:F-type H+-transporting ATPase subunit b
VSFNATLIGQLITFAIFVWFTMRFVWPPIAQTLSDRNKLIEDGVIQAKKARDDVQRAKKIAISEIKLGKVEVNNILNDANKRALLIIEEAKDKADAEVKKIVDGTKLEIDQYVAKSRKDLISEVGELVSKGVDKIVKSSKNNDSENIKEILKEIK